MSRALATGVSTGTSLAVLWKVLEGVQYPPVSLCPQRSILDLHWPSLLLGVALGLLLVPIFEALVALRLGLSGAREDLAGQSCVAGLPRLRGLELRAGAGVQDVVALPRIGEARTRHW